MAEESRLAEAIWTGPARSHTGICGGYHMLAPVFDFRWKA
jgi:hypothetical protein